MNNSKNSIQVKKVSSLVSVIFPCYNVEKYLCYSIESILNQDYKNLEILCMNDGSTDNTLEILKSYQKLDSRIIIINNDTNLGLIKTLNKALQCVTGEFFARMDADDYCPPNRISIQMSFLKDNQQYSIVSTAYNYFYINNNKEEYVPPIATHTNSLKFISLFCTPMSHAAVVGKVSLIKSGVYKYNKDYPHSEDFELFSRLVWQNINIANISDSLYWIRLNPNSVSHLYNEQQVQTHIKITARNIKDFIGIKTELDIKSIQLLSNRIFESISFQEIKNALFLLKESLRLYCLKQTLSEKEEQEIHQFLKLHVLNIIIQSNKIRFKEIGLKNIMFFFKTLALLKFNQIPYLFIKLKNHFLYHVWH